MSEGSKCTRAGPRLSHKDGNLHHESHLSIAILLKATQYKEVLRGSTGENSVQRANLIS